MTRTVRDSAAMLDWTGHPEPGSPWAVPAKERPYLEEVSREPGRLRIAFSAATPSGRPIDPEVHAAMIETAKTLEARGDVAGEAKAHYVYALALQRLGRVGACETPGRARLG